MHIMARQIQADQALEDDRPAREGAAQEDQEAGRRAAVGDHVEHGPEGRGLAEVARGEAVDGVEDAAEGVEQGAGARVQGHVVEGEAGEEDARVACVEWLCQ